MTSQEHVDALLGPDREEEVDPLAITAFMPIEPYDNVADVGCGPGYFSIPLAKYLMHGKLYALDVDDEMLEATRRRAAEARLGNVEVVKCSVDALPLPEGSLDGAFLAFVVHHNEDRVGFLKSVRALLRPRGWCAVLEWRSVETEDGPPPGRRVAPHELRRMAQEAGFRFLSSRELNPRQYMALLRKDG